MTRLCLPKRTLRSDHRSVPPRLPKQFSISGVGSTLRGELVSLLIRPDESKIEGTLERVMKVATAVEQRRMTLDLSSRRSGVEVLIRLVESGAASPRVLLDAVVKSKLASLATDDQETRLEKLVAGLPPEDEQMQAVIRRRKTAYLTGDRKSRTWSNGLQKELFGLPPGRRKGKSGRPKP